jgi:hypothetical protein
MYDIKITFATPKPLSQHDGLELWGIGSYFRRVGSKTYYLKSQAEGDSALALRASLVEKIKEIINQPIDVEKFDAKELA